MEKKHLENLKRLRDYLKKRYGEVEFDKHFNMKIYADYVDGVKSFKGMSLFDLTVNNECDTCCCVLGHSPYALPHTLNTDNLECLSWDEYCEYVFGIEGCSLLWDFLFSQRWPSNIQYAIERLDWVIEHHDQPDSFFEMGMFSLGRIINLTDQTFEYQFK